jgi:starch phosphorylase
MFANRYMLRSLPPPLAGLAELAIDTRWSWNHASDVLWKTIDAGLWEATGNPWFVLESVGQDRLAELVENKAFLLQLQEQVERRNNALTRQPWFAARHGDAALRGIAYFSMEFGLTEALPLYSGGLGILAGDYLKTAGDLGLPAFGVGLLYQQGYFRQSIDAAGKQTEFYPYNDPAIMPIMPLRDKNDNWVKVEVALPGRVLSLRAWEVVVGRIRLYLLDSNDPLNTPSDRGITEKLYGGSHEIRLQQEIALGIGGWRLLETLGISCDVCHLNEGHAAFAVLERAASFAGTSNTSIATALACTRAGNIFTTHTPVDAAFDRFPVDLFLHYSRDYADNIGLNSSQLLSLGRIDGCDDTTPFNMAYLALHGCSVINGVSRLHGRVSRKIFQPLFPRWPQRQVPVTYVTNGVHMPSWDSVVADTLWTDTCGKRRWHGALETMEEQIGGLSDNELWEFRSKNRQALIDFVRQRVVRQRKSMGLARDINAVPENALLDPNALTIGFGRRFTSYKRPNLLLHDPERLAALLSNSDRPVQLILAGKAHPRDLAGKELIRQWISFALRSDIRGKVIFLEDYDIEVAGKMVQGMDLWINTPRRPWEASGTSGMKVLVNGGLNLSELDGWWAEAWCTEVGWALGDGREHDHDTAWDATEADQLYRILEEEVIPTFYNRDEHGIPNLWVARMWASMSRLTPRFSSNRMVREYVEKLYLPAAEAYDRRCREGGRGGKEIVRWREMINAHWPFVHFGRLRVESDESGHTFHVPVYCDDLNPDFLKVELYADPESPDLDPDCIAMTPGEAISGTVNGFIYQVTVSGDRSSSVYTPRIIPYHPLASVPLEEHHILWYG